ncbi:phosphatase PAP2 family protein [Streptomyces daliensis]|uniref:Phosphatase PAP2 family protein n=1 Tax=Streptomyces daliensis TaxID=299421 RepID=A0A8T4J063_9ACTN|nr:phosphatase PAP2 family protein [Streptomyces daliensis]
MSPDSRPEPVSPQDGPGRALAHAPHRSDGRLSHTPRDLRNTGRHDRSGTLPPVPERSISFLRRLGFPGRAGRPERPERPGSARLRAVLTAAFCLLVLSAVTWQIASRGPLRAADERLGDAMRRASPPVPLAELLADLGNMEVALSALAVAMACALWRARRRKPVLRYAVLPYAVAMAAVPLVVSLLKAWIGRAGPLGGSGFYPSGHAATAAVAFGGAALLLLPHVRRGWPPLAAAVALTLLNGPGLVWRGYHWPLDVLASWCLAWVLLTAAYAVASRTAPASPEPPG